MDVYSTLTQVAQKMEMLHVPYMLSGSVAMGFYATVRTTFDIDIVVELYQKDVPGFVTAFPDHYIYEEGIYEEIKRLGMFNVIDNKTGIKIDFILRKNSEYDRLAFSRRKLMDNFLPGIFVISLEDLVIAKLRWIQDIYSHRQISDLEQLLSNPDIDTKYVAEWVNKISLKTFNLVIL